MRSCVNIPAAVKVLTVHGDADEVVPLIDSEELHMLLTSSAQAAARPAHSYSVRAAADAASAAAQAAAARHTLLAVRGADHAFSSADQLAEAVEQVCEWLAPRMAALKNGVSAVAPSQQRFTFGL